MEIHSHTHAERKKFTHYLWEFLMLFLAEFCDQWNSEAGRRQLKNSGGIRLIANKAATDGIIAYDAVVRLYSLDISEGVKDLRVPVMLQTFKLFDLKCCPDLKERFPLPKSIFPSRNPADL